MLSLRFFLSLFTAPGGDILWLPWTPLEQSWDTLPAAPGLYRLRLCYQDVAIGGASRPFPRSKPDRHLSMHPAFQFDPATCRRQARG